MKIYHYTHIENWNNISGSTNRSGIRASHRMGEEYIEAWETLVVNALLEPVPESWEKSKHFKGIWDELQANVGRLLLEIEVSPNDNGVFVVDRGHMEGYFYTDKEGIPKHHLHPTREDAERAYFQSRIPLNEYMVKKDELGYSLPQVIVTHHIPKQDIAVSKNQPLIEHELNQHLDEDEINRLRFFVPELDDWLNSKVRHLRENTRGRVSGELF